ncbi:MAG TPA: hypothetical protein VM639_00785 [Dongiaceae bacterium]|nr:hypothetical protein [Dongiaceae bacterium]
MPFKQPLVSFNTGYLGPYMRGRTDLKEYLSGALDVNNVVILPHGGVQRRRGLGNVYEFTGISRADFQYALIMTYSFNRDQEYVIAFMPNGTAYIFRNRVFKATIVHPYAKADLRRVRWSQQLDRIILTHPRYPPKKLFRNGRDTSWGIGDIAFIHLPQFRYNVSQTLTPSAVTANTSITLTLNGTFAYFSSYYAQGVIIIPDPSVTNQPFVTTTGFPQDATGGTAARSAGTAANAFDGSTGTACNCGANGWIGYSWGATSHAVEIVGINVNTTATVDLIFETDSSTAFAAPVRVGTLTGVTLTAGTVSWFDVPTNAGNTCFRVRVTNGATLDLKDVTFAFGLRVTGTVGATALGNTNASTTWTEQMWSPAHGYPGCSTFYADRLVFSGIRDIPNALVARNTGDYFNFDDSATTAAKTFKFIANSAQNQTIYNILPSRTGLIVLASDGEFSASTTNNAAASPTAPLTCYQQTQVGSANIPPEYIGGQVLFISQDRKTVSRFTYDFTQDAYNSMSLTLYAHDLFVDLEQLLELPRRLAYLPNYRDTQSSILFVPCNNGICCTLTYDRSSSVRAWATWDTPNGSFWDCTVAHSLQDATVGVIAEAYFLVSRTINGSQRFFLEVFENQQDVYLDHWEQATNTTPSTGPYSFTEGIANTDIRVSISDDNGLAVIGDFTTDNSGNFTLPVAVAQPFAGFRYETRLETMPIAPELASMSLKGRPTRVIEAIITFDGSLDATVNDRPVIFRQFDKDTFDTTTPLKTGIAKMAISNVNGATYDPTVQLRTDAPVPMNVLNLTVTYKAGNS